MHARTIETVQGWNWASGHSHSADLSTTCLGEHKRHDLSATCLCEQVMGHETAVLTGTCKLQLHDMFLESRNFFTKEKIYTNFFMYGLPAICGLKNEWVKTEGFCSTKWLHTFHQRSQSASFSIQSSVISKACLQLCDLLCISSLVVLYTQLFLYFHFLGYAQESCFVSRYVRQM